METESLEEAAVEDLLQDPELRAREILGAQWAVGLALVVEVKALQADRPLRPLAPCLVGLVAHQPFQVL